MEGDTVAGDKVDSDSSPVGFKCPSSTAAGGIDPDLWVELRDPNWAQEIEFLKIKF